MIILYIMAKSKGCVVKTVILKRPKKRGTILRKMLTTHYGIKEIDGDIYPGGKGVITVVSYRRCNEFIPIKSFKNAIFVENRPFLEVKVNIHPEYDPSISAFMLENYFKCVASTNGTAYQMNLIKM